MTGHIDISPNSVDIDIYGAMPVLKTWLASFAWEEATFSRYRDDALLDGVMTAGQMRQLVEIFQIRPEAPGQKAEESDEPLSDDDRLRLSHHKTP